ncbi:hypothetical protein V3G39_10700 [Dermatophilaceae bacterium Sec6.4]
MSADEPGETRTQYLPRTGSKITILIGLALLVAAVYAAVVPLSVASQTGVQFGCGTALSPNVSSFGKGYCSAVDQEAQYRAIALLIAALLIAGVGSALFGFDKRSRTRVIREDLGNDYDDEDLATDKGGRDSRGNTSVHARPGRSAIAAKSRSARSRNVPGTDRLGYDDLDRDDRDHGDPGHDDLGHDDQQRDDRDHDDVDDRDPGVSDDRPRRSRGPRDRR